MGIHEEWAQNMREWEVCVIVNVTGLFDFSRESVVSKCQHLRNCDSDNIGFTELTVHVHKTTQSSVLL